MTLFFLGFINFCDNKIAHPILIYIGEGVLVCFPGVL